MEPTPHQRVKGDVVVLDLQGPSCRVGDQDLRSVVGSWIERGRKRFLLNLQDVPHLDSASLADLVRAHGLVNRNGGRLTLVNISSRVRELLEMTRLSAVLEVVGSEEEGLR
jgi:anti-anti-sigma factor